MKPALLAAAVLLAGAAAVISMNAEAQTANGASGAGSVQLQGNGGAPLPPDSALANLQNGQVTADSRSAGAKVDAYPSDGSASDPNSKMHRDSGDSADSDANK